MPVAARTLGAAERFDDVAFPFPASKNLTKVKVTAYPLLQGVDFTCYPAYRRTGQSVPRTWDPDSHKEVGAHWEQTECSSIQYQVRSRRLARSRAMRKI